MAYTDTCYLLVADTAVLHPIALYVKMVYFGQKMIKQCFLFKTFRFLGLIKMLKQWDTVAGTKSASHPR